MAKECGTCMWFDGDFRDAAGFCDEKEAYVSSNNRCPKYREDADKVEQLKEKKE